MKINKHNSMGEFEIYTLGSPDFDNLTKTEKRLLLLPLVDVIRDYYKDPENKAKFEKWKSENNPA